MNKFLGPRPLLMRLGQIRLTFVQTRIGGVGDVR